MKTATSPLRLDALPAAARALLPKVASAVPGGILGGGTAIALQIGHRRSFDLDFFVSKKISPGLLHRLQKIGRATPLVDSSEELTCRIGDSKISVIWYPFKPLHPLRKTPPCPLFDLRDLASSKAYTIGRRGAWRDYVDVVAALEFGLTLRGMITEAEKRFGDAFNAKLFLEQLTYFDDIEDFTIEWLWSVRTPHAVQESLQQAAKTYLQTV